MKKAKTKILRCVSGAVVGVMLISSLAGCGKNKRESPSFEELQSPSSELDCSIKE